MVEKSGVEKFLFAMGLKSSWLKSPGLKGLGLKLGVEKSRVEMYFNHRLHIPTRTLSCPITTRTVSKKFSKVFRKFPIKFRALLPLAHFRKGNFSRIDLHKHCEETFRHL